MDPAMATGMAMLRIAVHGTAAGIDMGTDEAAMAVATTAAIDRHHELTLWVPKIHAAIGNTSCVGFRDAQGLLGWISIWRS